MKQGLWLLPSRHRIPSLKRFFDAAKQTGMTTGGMVLVNRDEFEKSFIEYATLELPANWHIEPVDANSVAEAMRAIWPKVQHLDWVGGLCDDHIPATQNWDTVLIDQTVGWNVVSSNDAWQAPKRIHGAIVWSGELLRTLGGIYPPGFKHFFVDDVWESLGRATNCWRVDMSVLVRHTHATKTKKSDGTTEHIGRYWSQDEATYRAWMQKTRPESIDAIMNLAEKHGVSVFRPKLGDVSVYIVTPCGDEKYDRRYTRSFENTTSMIRQCGGQVDWGEAPGSADLSLARARLFGAFLRSPHTHMMAIDSDMGWSALDVIRMIMLKRDFVAAAGPKKAYPIRFAFNLSDDNQEQLPFIEEGGTQLIEVTEIGMAFTLISRSCAERMAQAYPELNFQTENGLTEHDVFAPMIVNGWRKSEDFAFCHRWRKIGGKIFMLPSVKLSHTGSHTFEASVAEYIGVRDAAE
jgi:hypothetical protein